MHVIWDLIINNLNIRGERSWSILMSCWFCLHSALTCSAVCKVSEGFWHELVPSEVECGWLHLWHRNGHCTIDFVSHHYVCMDIIFGREIKSENLKNCDKRDYYYSWGINWSIHLQLACDSSFNTRVHMKFRVQFYVFILFIWSSVTMSVTCLCEWMKYEWVLSNSHLWVNFLVNSV